MGEGVGGGDNEFSPAPDPSPARGEGDYWSLGEPPFSYFVMLHMSKTLSLTNIREAQIEVSDVWILLQFL